MQNTQTVVSLTGMDGMGEQSLGEYMSYSHTHFIHFHWQLLMELQSEITTNISHCLRDDQRDAKLQTFKYTALMVLKRPQPQPSMGQEISLQVLTTVG